MGGSHANIPSGPFEGGIRGTRIQSTMVYPKGIHSKDALAKVNAGALASYIA
jgi:hypothetical protein